MTKINVLPSEISNMIAAGEVVERPASVVKELAENCIDAGATGITVEIKKGGITYIRVSDNGCGIAADEIETAFLRHATSKIKTAADLDGINTLGFRGEALASIAAVARVEIFTKPKEQTYGRCVTVEGGEVLENDEAGCADGTTMIVRNLFYNTPARMKFLKNDATETGYITDVVTKLILSHPEVAVNYINNGKTVPLVKRRRKTALRNIHRIRQRLYEKYAGSFLLRRLYERDRLHRQSAPCKKGQTPPDFLCKFTQHLLPSYEYGSGRGVYKYGYDGALSRVRFKD